MDALQTLKNALKLQKQGELQQAEKLFRKVVSAQPKNVPALNLLGALCVNSNRAREGTQLILRALRVNPNDVQGLLNLALGLKDLGEYEKAAASLKKANALDAKNVVVLNTLGSIYFDMARPLDAIPVYQKALNLNPNYTECWCNLSAALRETRQFEPAHATALKAIELDANAPQVHFNLAELYSAQALYSNAIKQYQKVLELSPSNPKALISLASAYRESDHPESALQVLKKLLISDPNNVDAHNAMGYLMEQSGNKKDAAASFSKAISVDPTRAIPHYRLAQIKGRECSQSEIAAMQKQLLRSDLKEEDRRYFLFGLAAAYDKLGKREEAFTAWKSANDIAAKRYKDDAEKTDIYYQSVINAVSKHNSDSPSEQENKGHVTPVFIVGMPRSGNTLTGQILASHSKIVSVGEVSFAYDMVATIKSLTGVEYPEGIEGLSQAHLVQLGQKYLDRLIEKEPRSTYVVDNTPLNFPHIGLLCLALPEAKIIHCVRNPIDTCFSIYKLPFEGAQTFAHDLCALGKRYTSYRALMKEWKRLFPGRILDVQYEQTVSDVEAQGRRVLQFLGLDYEDSILDFHLSKNLVRTPSASQVREPIYKNAIEAWRDYEDHLGELKNNLEDDA